MPESQSVHVNTIKTSAQLTYTNLWTLKPTQAAEECVIEFGCGIPSAEHVNQIDLHVQATVVMNLFSAKRLSQQLSAFVRRWEQQFGEIMLDMRHRLDPRNEPAVPSCPNCLSRGNVTLQDGVWKCFKCGGVVEVAGPNITVLIHFGTDAVGGDPAQPETTLCKMPITANATITHDAQDVNCPACLAIMQTVNAQNTPTDAQNPVVNAAPVWNFPGMMTPTRGALHEAAFATPTDTGISSPRRAGELDQLAGG